MPASLGERASNSSATRGRPPVMSRVLADSCGMRARTSPTAVVWPSLTVMIEPTWKVIATAWSVPWVRTSCPVSSINFTCGRRPLVCDLPPRFGSITTKVDKPVTSSTCLATVAPSSTCSNLTIPAYSVTIGRVCGSQVARMTPALICLPSSPISVAPYGTLCRSRSRPLSSVIITSPERAMTTFSPFGLVT